MFAAVRSGPSLSPASAPKSAGYRLLMLDALRRVRGRRDPASKALAAALRTTALGRIPREERDWIARIEARRQALASGNGPGPPEGMGPAEFARAVEWMSVPPTLGRFLLRVVRELSPRSCLELGTGFGISSAYQGAALELNGAGDLITIDVAEQWGEIARQGHSELGLDRRVEVLVGDPGETLTSALERAAPIDYAFIDSDHREHETLAVVEEMLPHLSEPALLLFDDVGFSSQEMERAWTRIGDHPRVSLAARFARMGAAVVSGES